MPEPDSIQPKPAGPELSGIIRKIHANFYYVDVSGKSFECSLKGLLKKELKAAGDEVVVGDLVLLDGISNPESELPTARIASVLPRTSLMPRPRVANINQVVIVNAIQQPAFDLHQLDRYLTLTALFGLSAVICIHKCDLAPDQDTLDRIIEFYQEKLGYQVIMTSIHQPDSLETLKATLSGKTSVLAGPSGAGKSSLLNAIRPDLNLRVGEVSDKIARGQHTTRHVELIAFDHQTYVADTPGFSHLKFDTVLPAQIESCFPEFTGLRDQCRYSDCLHLPVKTGVSQEMTNTEPNQTDSVLTEAEADSDGGCAIQYHPAIATSRYTSYLSFIEEAKTFEAQQKKSSSKSEYGMKTVSSKGQKDLSVLRLKEKSRQVSRRTERQQVLTDVSALNEDDFEDADN